MAATQLSKSLFEAVLKTYYPKPSDLVDAAYKRSPIMQRLRKDPGFSGNTKQVPWLVDGPAGGGQTYSTALAANNPSVNKKILVAPVTYYQQVGLDNLVIEASRNDAGALMKAAKTELERGLQSVGNTMSYHFYRSSNGEVGQGDGTAANLTSTTWIFANRAQVFDLHVGDVLLFSATAAGAKRSATGLSIVSIDRGAGSVVLSDTPNSLSASVAAADYVFRKGTMYDNGTGSKFALGLTDYIPLTAPTSGDSFTDSALDRSTDSRMSGVRVDGSSKTIEAGMIELIGEVQHNRGDADLILMNPLQGAKLVTALGSKVFYDQVKSSDKSFGGKVMKVACGGVVADLVLDSDCPVGYGFSLTSDDWECISYGNAPKVQDNDGNTSRQSSSFDGVNILLAAYYNWICYAPHQQGRLTLPSL